MNYKWLERGGKRAGQVGQITYCPPKSCIPSKAKTTMKRNRRKSKLMMDFIEFRRETTRFLKEFQYLTWKSKQKEGHKEIIVVHTGAHTHKRQKKPQTNRKTQTDRSNMTNLANTHIRTTKAEEGRVEQIAIRSVGGIKQISVSGCTAASLTEWQD